MSPDDFCPEALLPRIDEKIDRSAPDGCWEWTGAKSDNGYGTIWFEGKTRLAHRVVFGLLAGEIPEGLHIDHLCRVRHCVNPDHMEPVPQRINTLRGTSPVVAQVAQTHCIHGHPLSGDNLYIRRDRFARMCRTCARLRMRARSAK